MTKIILNCLFQNDSLENLFKADIDKNQSVKELEKIIKTDLDLNKFSFRKVKILINTYERDSVFESQNIESYQKIYEYFDHPPDDHIHILICKSGKNLNNLRFFFLLLTYVLF